MIVIAGKVRIRPERRNDAIAAAVAMSVASEAEAGCIRYRFSADLRDPDIFYLFEAWESADALKGHGQTSHMAEFNRQLPDLIASKPELKRYEVAAVRDL